ncbi:MAG: hypothetical protein K9H64_12355 [Bacteroidales bacterium]|nr:hypothetical protein [Bacteroidales bacterium]MCF8456836.1 hypothetical protein [Bacteroidales bacterium]
MKRKIFSIKVHIASILLLLVGLLFSSCSKEEGFGGNSHIKGTLIEQVYNDDFSLLLYEQPARDKDVFIIFGNDETIGDNVKTNYNGQFEFSFLHKGSYAIFYYSDDSLSAYGENSEILYPVELGKKETIDLDTLHLLNSIQYNEGKASIKGRVFLINYQNSSTWPNLVVKDTSLAQEQEIYITYGNHEFYDDRIRTSFDGTFVFQDLIKGQYEIFLYSEDVSGGTEDIVISLETEITGEFQMIDLGDIYIKQL